MMQIPIGRLLVHASVKVNSRPCYRMGSYWLIWPGKLYGLADWASRRGQGPGRHRLLLVQASDGFLRTGLVAKWSCLVHVVNVVFVALSSCQRVRRTW